MYLNTKANPVGDLNQDARTDYDDFVILSANFGRSHVYQNDGDLDGDGEVGFSDFLLLSAHFGAGSA